MKKLYKTPVIITLGMGEETLLSSSSFNQGSFVQDTFTENTGF